LKITAHLHSGIILVEREGDSVLTGRNRTVTVPEGLRFAAEGDLLNLLDSLVGAVNHVLDADG
jgi:hypothetical protein